MRIVLKSVGLIVAGIVGFILLYFTVAYCLSRITVNREVKTKNEIPIYILSNGVHTDIVVPVKTEAMDWSTQVKFKDTKGGDSSFQFVGFGWGDKGFYLETPTWAELKFSVAFKAVFALGHSLIHATFHKEMIENENCRKIIISKEDYVKLISYIQASFQKDAQGHFINIKTNANYSNDDAFYDAIGSYSLFKTCNTWSNNALKACGQKASLWTPFDTGIFYHYRQ